MEISKNVAFEFSYT